MALLQNCQHWGGSWERCSPYWLALKKCWQERMYRWVKFLASWPLERGWQWPLPSQPPYPWFFAQKERKQKEDRAVVRCLAGIRPGRWWADQRLPRTLHQFASATSHSQEVALVSLSWLCSPGFCHSNHFIFSYFYLLSRGKLGGVLPPLSQWILPPLFAPFEQTYRSFSPHYPFILLISIQYRYSIDISVDT